MHSTISLLLSLTYIFYFSQLPPKIIMIWRESWLRFCHTQLQLISFQYTCPTSIRAIKEPIIYPQFKNLIILFLESIQCCKEDAQHLSLIIGSTPIGALHCISWMKQQSLANPLQVARNFYKSYCFFPLQDTPRALKNPVLLRFYPIQMFLCLKNTFFMRSQVEK